ncbi:MAG: hypothetical protein JW786_09175 [Desulfobacterales bacterium]|nr:hypothetical protein [Desulfobacterales bacterium]
MNNPIMLIKPYIAAIFFILIGMAVNMWGCYLFGNSLLIPLTEPKEQRIFGFLNVFLGLGIVTLAAVYARSEYKHRKIRSSKIESSICPNCLADLGKLTSLKWKSWTVSVCVECGAHLKASRIVGCLSLLIGVGIALFTALPMITGRVSVGHWWYGIILLIFGPSIGFWFLLSRNRYEMLEKK